MNINNYLIKLIIFSFLAIFIESCNSPATSPYIDITFEKKAVMDSIGRASAVAFVIADKAYVTLGKNGNANDSLKECWQYNPDSNKWSQKAPFPGLARVKAIAVVVNDTAYVGLGFARNKGAYSGGNLKDLWIYVPQTDVWSRIEDFPSSATDACVSFVFQNNIYIGGGFAGTGFSNEFWKYDTQTHKWKQLSKLPSSARAGSLLCSNGEHIYFGTGYWTFMENDWWEYFPTTDTWIQRRKMPDNGRVNGITLVVNNRFFVSTGRHFRGNLTGGHVKSDIIEYNPELNVWYNRGNIPASGRENAITFTINGKGYIGFGENDTEILNDLWSFEP